MATRPYVPRVDGESSLGVPTKKWGNIYANKIDEGTDLGNNASLGYRQPSTAQRVGDIRYHATLPAGWYLECTTAGTSGSGTLTITSPTVGGTVSDGTVTWTVRKNASTQDLTGYLPLSGGILQHGSGTNYTLIKENDDAGAMVLAGGVTWEKSSQLVLHGKNHPSMAGAVYMLANDGANSEALQLMPNGALNLGSHSLDKSAVVAESLGVNGYRKYASGLVKQWGEATLSNGQNFVPFNISFPNSDSNHRNYTLIAMFKDSTGNLINPSGCIAAKWNAATMLLQDPNNVAKSASWLAIGE